MVAPNSFFDGRILRKPKIGFDVRIPIRTAIPLKNLGVSMNTVKPMALNRMAASIARTHGDKGAIIITFNPDGIRIGSDGLSLEEVREALCVGIYYSYISDDMETPEINTPKDKK